MKSYTTRNTEQEQNRSKPTNPPKAEKRTTYQKAAKKQREAKSNQNAKKKEYNKVSNNKHTESKYPGKEQKNYRNFTLMFNLILLVLI